MNKIRYLAVYDYGTGGVWCYIYAKSKKEIEDKYPELELVEKEPTWLTGEIRSTIEKVHTYNIEDDPKDFLLELVKKRSANG